ncbi:MAG TPA: ferredoxin [Streptosporangiaceae bacterium]|nr:ferredoxin [Streptosporangiaceae bacterium]
MTRRRSEPAGLTVNPIACQAHGMCIELLPELITADPWGYPLIAPGPVPAQLLPLARRAVGACPTMALLLSSPGRHPERDSATAR